MRRIALPSAAWLGVLQAFVPSQSGFGLETASRLVALATVFGTITAMIYHLGEKHQAVANARDNVTKRIERIERGLEAIDHVLTMIREWQVKVERRLRRLETGE